MWGGNQKQSESGPGSVQCSTHKVGKADTSRSVSGAPGRSGKRDCCWDLGALPPFARLETPCRLSVRCGDAMKEGASSQTLECCTV